MKRARNKKDKKSYIAETKIKKPRVKKKKTKKKSKRGLTIFLIVVLLIFIALGFGGEDNALIPIDTSTGKMNVLVLGVDDDGLRTDTILLASYDFDDDSLKLMSIPRDTKIYVTNRRITRKINEVHAMTKKNGEIMGPLASVEAVTALTGIPINYYVEFNFDAIDAIMEKLGPVEFDVPDIEGNGRGMNYDDPAQDLHIHLKPGLQKLEGNQIQQFLRYRKSNNERYDGSDTSRVERQQELLKAILDQKINLSLIVKIPDIFADVKDDIKTNFSVGEIARYSTHLLDLSMENVSTYSLPGENTLSGAWYFVCDLEKTAELISTEFGYDASDITNRVEITGEKIDVNKRTSSENSNRESETSRPTSSPSPKPSATPDAEDDTLEKTLAPTKEPTETKAPQKTATPKPTEDDDVIVIE